MIVVPGVEFADKASYPSDRCFGLLRPGRRSDQEVVQLGQATGDVSLDSIPGLSGRFFLSESRCQQRTVEQPKGVNLSFDNFLVIASQIVGEPNAGRSNPLHRTEMIQVPGSRRIVRGNDRRPDVGRTTDAVATVGDILLVGGEIRFAFASLVLPPPIFSDHPLDRLAQRAGPLPLEELEEGIVRQIMAHVAQCLGQAIPGARGELIGDDRAVIVRAAEKLVGRNALLVEKVVERENPETDPTGRDQGPDGAEWSRGSDRKRQRTDAHRADHRVPSCPAAKILSNRFAQVKDARSLGGSHRLQKPTAQPVPARGIVVHGAHPAPISNRDASRRRESVYATVAANRRVPPPLLSQEFGEGTPGISLSGKVLAPGEMGGTSMSIGEGTFWSLSVSSGPGTINVEWKQTRDGGYPLPIGNTGGRIKVVIVEDESLYRDLLRVALSQHPLLEVVGTFADGQSALTAMTDLNAQVAILDIDLRSALNGVQVGLMLRQRWPKLGIVLLSNHGDPQFISSLPSEIMPGWSYLLKKSVSDVNALERAIEGATVGLVVLDPRLATGMRPRVGGVLARLTPRQQEVLALIAQGFTNAAIAQQLTLSEKSVENQINLLYQQLEVDRGRSALHPRVKAVLTYLNESRFSRPETAATSGR